MIANYYHSDVALTFKYNSFIPVKDKIKNLHRYDISKQILKEIKQLMQSAPGAPPMAGKWHVKIQNNCNGNYPLKLSKRRGLGESNLQEIHHSQEKFKKFSKLSLRTDEFFLFEYTEKNPLILSNVGMASRLSKYYYAMKIIKKICEEQSDDADDRDQVVSFNSYIREKFGDHGEDVVLKDSEFLPLEGQLVGKTHEGVVILENNLYKVPVFKQKTRKNDFVLVKTVEAGETKYYLRRIKASYVAGQIQPKAEVFCPYSRQFNTFMKKFLKFCINKSFKETKEVHVNNLKEIFKVMNDHTLKKTIKLLGGEQTTSDNKLYTLNEQLRRENRTNEYGDETEAQITPEELCLYERMYQTFYDLNDFGIHKLKSSDKISVIKTKFYRNHLDSPYECAIARRIIQELMLSSWNLSQSFLSAFQTQGRMHLTGYGDPTNGHGGINFIKLPLKISRHESALLRKKKKGKPSQKVTGTGADLRKLSMKFLHEKLGQYGFTENTLAGLDRWDKIEILRDIANTHSDLQAELRQFKRETRMTTQMQKEKYQSDINKLLMKQISNLTTQNWSDIPSDNDFSTVEDMKEIIQAEEQEITHYRGLKSEDEDGNVDKSGQPGGSETSSEEESEGCEPIQFG